MTKSADNPRAVAPFGSGLDVGPELGELARRMRGTVTPVVGYLELISQDTRGMSPQHYLDWLSTIEQRLHAVRQTSDEISRIVDVLRESINDREASTPRDPEAPAD